MSSPSLAKEVVFPVFQPVEAPAYVAFRRNGREALDTLSPPTDKKYTNWDRLKIGERFAGKDIGSVPPTFTIDQSDYDTGIKTIAIPLKKAIKDWPDNVQPHLGKALPPDSHYFAALSAAYYTDGAAIVVPPNTKANITATFSAESGKLNAYRTIILVGEAAEATYTEICEDAALKVEAGPPRDRASRRPGLGTVVVHAVEAFAAPNSSLKFYGLQNWGTDVTNLAIYRAHQERDATVRWLLGQFGSGLTQLDLESTMLGEGAETSVHSTFYGTGTQHLDQRLVAHHAAQHTTSDTYTRGVVTDFAKQVYRGMIQIDPGAHGSSADQNGHVMLMANTAHADMIPGLEIDANDVVAGHGATVGQIDEEQLFYLRARGIPEVAARQMIIRGFYEALFRDVENVAIRERFWQAVQAKLAD